MRYTETCVCCGSSAQRDGAAAAADATIQEGVTMEPTTMPRQGQPSDTGAIVGGTVGAAAAVLLLAILVICLRKRRKGTGKLVTTRGSLSLVGSKQPGVVKFALMDAVGRPVMWGTVLEMMQEDHELNDLLTVRALWHNLQMLA